MKEDKFIKDNSMVWQSLEATLQKLKSKGFNKFGKDELDNFINLYNRTCGHLSYCRTYYGNTNTTEYLNRLVASAHGYIYTADSSNIKKLLKFFASDLPGLLRQNIRYIIISTLVFLLGSGISYVYTSISPDNATFFLPKGYTENIDFSGNSARLWDSSIMSSFILTNNIKVGLTSFALGITMGIGTIIVLTYNGFMLGSLSALAHASGHTSRYWSLILPHGILELFAIFICGAAGLIIGYSLINPGKYSRKDSFILKSKTAIKLVFGTIPMFVIAGLIEGFLTPSTLPETFKLSFALFTLILIILYILFPGSQRKPGATGL